MDYPVVFIPGLFGSMGNDVIKGTGDFSFGLAEKVYRPFIEILNSMGYIEESNLFINYYNWRVPVLESVERYLVPTIEKVKLNTGANKVIIIGHSLGGLLGRTYATYFNHSSVDKLIMIGTPNLGAVDAYSFYSGGKLPYPKVEGNILYNALKLGYILYYYLFEKIHYIEGLRNIFPIAKDLLPCYEYGNYLSLEGNEGREIPIESMSVENSFLNGLNKGFMDKDNLFIIGGNGIETNKKFMVEPNEKEETKWTDGKPTKIISTKEGDGTVTIGSTFGYLGGNNTILNGNHTEILYKSKSYLSSILDKPLTRDTKDITVEKVYIILADNCNSINIKTLESNKISKDYVKIRDNRVQGISLPHNRFLAMVVGHEDLDIKLDVATAGLEMPIVLTAIIDKNGFVFDHSLLKYKL